MEKTYVFDTNEKCGFDSSALIASLMNNRGVDPNLMAMLTNASHNQDAWGGGCWWIWVIIMFWLWGGNRNGFGFGGNEGLPAQLNGDFGREVLLQAINGNGSAIQQLSTTLNCDINALQGAIGNVLNAIQSVGSLVGMSSQQIINSIQLGTCTVTTQLAECCCGIKDAITRLGYENQLANLNLTNVLLNAINNVATGQDRGFATVAYETQRQTCDLNKTILDSTQKIVDGQRAAEMRELQNRIDALREKNSSLISQLSQEHQTAAIQAYQAQALAPVNAALSALSAEVAGIKCKLPETITVPQNTGTYITPCQETLLGLNGFGFNGLYNNGSIWG